MKAAEEPDSVQGERAQAVVNAVRSVQSRVSSLLAAGLMIGLGVAALTWYYARTLGQRTHARVSAQAASASRAQGEMVLPPLPPIVPPAGPQLPAAPADSPPAPEQPVAAVPLAAAPPGAAVPGAQGSAVGVPPAKSPRELVRERRLSGDVFAREPEPSAPAPTGSGAASGAAATGSAPEGNADARRSGSALGGLLVPTLSAPVQAQLLPTERFLLPKGAFIDCTLETAIDSTLPGMTTCVTAADTFGADGKVVLLERGSKLVGETRGQVQQGQARVFVLWTQARTPTGVVVPLDSPGTDALGRSGLPGEVEHHFWQRFGAAMLISVVNGAVQAGVQAANHSGGAVVYAPSAAPDVMTEVLKDTVSIPPTIIKANGDRIQVLVARDVDFRSVYELHAPVIGH